MGDSLPGPAPVQGGVGRAALEDGEQSDRQAGRAGQQDGDHDAGTDARGGEFLGVDIGRGVKCRVVEVLAPVDESGGGGAYVSLFRHSGVDEASVHGVRS